MKENDIEGFKDDFDRSIYAKLTKIASIIENIEVLSQYRFN